MSQQAYRDALHFDVQKEAFDVLISQGFPEDKSWSICRNPGNYGQWSNFVDLKKALVDAGLWGRLYQMYDE